MLNRYDDDKCLKFVQTQSWGLQLCSWFKRKLSWKYDLLEKMTCVHRKKDKIYGEQSISKF